MNIYVNMLLHISVVIFSLACLSRLVALLLGWFLSTLSKHKITIGHVTLLGVHDIVVESPGLLNLRIRHVSLVSRLFSNPKRLFGIFVGTIDAEVPALKDLVLKTSSQSIHINERQKKNFKIPSLLIYLIQRMHFRVESIKFLLQQDYISINVYLSTGINLVFFPDKSNSFVSSHFALDHIELKIKDDKTIYLNTSMGIKLDLLLSYYFETIETVKVSVDMLSVMVYEGLISVLSHIKTSTQCSNSIESVTKQTAPLFTKLLKVFPIIPKDRSFRIQNVSCSISDVEETRNMSFKIESLTEEGALDSSGKGIVENMSMNNAKMYINNTDFLSIKSIKLSPFKVSVTSGSKVTASVTTLIDTLAVQWYNTELISWATALTIPSCNKSKQTNITESPSTTLTMTTVTRFTSLSLNLFEDSKSARKLITLTLPSLDIHHSNSADKLSIGVASKKLLLQLPIPLNIKKKLRDKLSVIQEYHLWGQVIDVKSLTLKVQKYQDKMKVEVDMQSSVLEWNYHFSNLIMEVMPQFIIMLPKSVKSQKPSLPAKPLRLEIDCKIEQLNVFLLSNEQGEVCSLLHLNKLILEKKGSRSVVCLENMYLHAIERLPEIYLCNIDLEETDTLVSVIKANVSRDVSSISGAIGSIAVHWEPTHHRVLDSCIRKTKGSIVCIADLLMYQRATPPKESSTATGIGITNVNVHINRTSLNFITSPSHQISIEITPLHMKSINSLSKVDIADKVTVYMDSHQIFRITDITVEQVKEDSQLCSARATQPSFASNNKAWILKCRELRVFLPHKYGKDSDNSNNPTIAQAVDEAQNCFKMLKALHRAPRLASDGEPLYADCRVEIKLILVEFEDYDFDQRISQNYLIMQHALRDNEVETQTGRQGSDTTDQLDLSELADNTFLQTSSTFWETYYDYQRYYKEAREEPVKLATLLLSDVGLCLCADETLNGHDNIVNMINQLDDGTCVPPDLRFTTLWGRVIFGECATFSLQLRNFSSELIHIKNVSLKGLLCGAEAISPNHAIRKTRVVLRKPWRNFDLARGMNPLKYFYDLTLETTEMEMSWGPCFEPSYQFFGQSLDKLAKKSRDPSPLLPFWDKTRNLMRGKFALRSDVYVIKLLSEREPLNTSEYLSVCFNDFLFKWSNGLLTFDGDTVIKNNSESKYGECKIVTLPRLLLNVHMIWKTANRDPNAHWDCVPYDPKFVKLREDEEWDSFVNFRSVCLDLDMMLTFAKPDGQTDTCPKVNLYSHTLKWLESWASVMVGTVSRPVFKGKLWNNVKPSKKKLTRHYRKVHFETEFAEGQLEIWSSYRKRAGAKVTVGCGKLEVTQKLALVSWPPIETFDSEGSTEYIHLKRRPRVVWNTEKCTAHFTDIQGILMGSSDAMAENVFQDSTERSPEHFLFSINEVEYRQRGETFLSTESLNSTNSRDAKLYTHWIVISDVKASINIDTRTLILAFLEQYENSRALSRDLSSDALRTISLEGEKGNRRSPRAAGAVFETSPNQSNDDLLSQFDEDFVTVVTGDEKSNSSREKLAAEQACSDTDIKTRQWSIQMTNGQMAMQGPELNGFVMLTTGKCKVLGTEHWPALRGGEFFSKFSWTCIVEHVQYFATVDEAPECHIPWLDESMIGIRRSRYSSNQEPDTAESMIGELDEQEECLKGIVREVYKHDTKQCATQLQRIVSRCGCLLSFVTFGTQPIEDIHSSTEDLQYTTESMYSSDLLSAFSLRHKSLEVATNSHQYKMIIDCVNNLLLRTEGSKRSSIGRLLHAFSLMRSGEAEARKTIAALQKEIRECLSKIRDIERQLYDFNFGVQSQDKLNKTRRALIVEKQKLNINRVNLRLTISAFKEFKLKEGAINKDQVVDQLMEVRKNEICIDDANWTLTGECGQIPIMEVNIQGGFAYSRTVYSTTYSTDAAQSSDFSSGHKFTLGHFCIRNLQNDRNPQNVLFPMNDNESGANPAYHCLRVYLSQQHNPVGGIIINHHLEINLVPLVLRFETVFWREIQKFFVGEDKKEEEGLQDYYDLDDSSSINPLNFEIRAQNSKRDRKFRFSSRKNVRSGGVDPHQALDEMSERSKKRFFNFVKIQQFPILISYKGKITVNEKTILFPEIEIKERTHTWKELALEIKKISVPKVALSLGKLKQSYSAPISGLSNVGAGSESSENTRSKEVYRFLTGSDANEAPPKKKKGLGLASLRRNKPKKAAPPIPVRPTLVPNDNFVKECDNPGEWEDNSLGERINELKAMSEEPLLSPDEEVDEINDSPSPEIAISSDPIDIVTHQQLG